MDKQPEKKPKAEKHTRTTRPSNVWYPLSSIPEGFFRPGRQPGAIYSSEQALTISPFFAGLRLFQSTLSRLPLVVYQYQDDGSRVRARQHPAYKLLHDQPNPAQTRNTFVNQMVRELFLEGNFYAQIRWRGNGNVYGIYPLHAGQVQQITLDDDWNKSYKLVGVDDPVPSQDIIHVFIHSKDGIRGTPLIEFAAESLGLHRQVLESATAYYQNAARPSVYVKLSGPSAPGAKENLETAAENFKKKYQGARRTGEVPMLRDGDILPTPDTSAVDAALIEALSNSVADVARWFNIDPLLLGDRSNAWSNLAAANASFYQRSVADLLDNIEAEFNVKLFGADGVFYCEFMTDALLRGDPVQQSQIWQTGLTAGYLLRSEVREWLNLPPVAGMEVPTYPLNQGPQMAEPTPEQPALNINVPAPEEPQA